MPRGTPAALGADRRGIGQAGEPSDTTELVRLRAENAELRVTEVYAASQIKRHRAARELAGTITVDGR
jgi:hypothetical protein